MSIIINLPDVKIESETSDDSKYLSAPAVTFAGI